MMHIVEQTHAEKTAMFMKCSKKELVEMLIQCNIHLELMSGDLNKIGVYSVNELTPEFIKSISNIEKTLNR